MKKFVTIMAVILVFALAGCAGAPRTRQVISGEKFSKAMEKAGYDVTDVTDEAYAGAGMTQVLQALKGGSVVAFFFVAESENVAKLTYALYKDSVAAGGENNLIDEVHGENYSCCSFEDVGAYTYCIWVENTFLQIYGGIDDKDEVIARAKALGY